MSKNILILGGYGNTGIKVAELLLKHSDTRLTLAARNMERVLAAAKDLNTAFDTDRVAGVYADASDEDSLIRALREMDMVVVASGTAEYVRTIATATLKAGVDYLDIQYSTAKVARLKSMADEIESRGRCFITEGGFHPGLPAAIVRYGSQYFDKLEIAIVGSVVRQDWGAIDAAPSTMIEFVRELANFQSTFYKDGEWKKANLWSTEDFIEMDFGEPFGTQLCAPMFLEELAELPKVFPALNHTGFYIVGFGKFIDMVIMPFIFVMLKLFPKLALNPMAGLMYRSLVASSKPPYTIILKLEASGENNGEPKKFEVQLSHEDGYWFTAIPVAACLLQYLDGSINQPGLHTMGNLVEPKRLLKDMEMMGIEVSEA